MYSGKLSTCQDGRRDDAEGHGDPADDLRVHLGRVVGVVGVEHEVGGAEPHLRGEDREGMNELLTGGSTFLSVGQCQEGARWGYCPCTRLGRCLCWAEITTCAVTEPVGCFFEPVGPSQKRTETPKGASIYDVHQKIMDFLTTSSLVRIWN